MTRKQRIRRDIKKSMVNLGTYKVDFEPTIKITVELVEQYEYFTELFKESGYDYQEQTQTGTKKAPIVTTLESLRKDILQYYAQLGLTPSGLQKLRSVADKKPGSQLGEILRGLENDQ